MFCSSFYVIVCDLHVICSVLMPYGSGPDCENNREIEPSPVNIMKQNVVQSSQGE